MQTFTAGDADVAQKLSALFRKTAFSVVFLHVKPYLHIVWAKQKPAPMTDLSQSPSTATELLHLLHVTDYLEAACRSAVLCKTALENESQTELAAQLVTGA